MLAMIFHGKLGTKQSIEFDQTLSHCVAIGWVKERVWFVRLAS